MSLSILSVAFRCFSILGLGGLELGLGLRIRSRSRSIVGTRVILSHVVNIRRVTHCWMHACMDGFMLRNTFLLPEWNVAFLHPHTGLTFERGNMMDSKSLFQNIHLSWLCLIAQPRVFHVGGSKQHSLAEREVSLPPWLGGLSGKSGWVCCKRGALMDDINCLCFARKETQRRG